MSNPSHNKNNDHDDAVDDGGPVVYPYPRWMTMNTAARYIDRSVPALRTLVARGMIPSHKVNGLRVFGRHEIDEWVRSGGSTLPLLGYRTRPR